MSFGRQYGFRIAVLVGAIWVVGVTLVIWRQPERGATDPGALASAYERALADRDDGAVEHLLFEPPRGTGDDLIAAESGSCGAEVRVRAAGTGLVLSTVGGRECGRLPIALHGDRWYVDPWASLTR